MTRPIEYELDYAFDRYLEVTNAVIVIETQASAVFDSIANCMPVRGIKAAKVPLIVPAVDYLVNCLATRAVTSLTKQLGLKELSLEQETYYQQIVDLLKRRDGVYSLTSDPYYNPQENPDDPYTCFMCYEKGNMSFKFARNFKTLKVYNEPQEFPFIQIDSHQVPIVNTPRILQAVELITMIQGSSESWVSVVIREIPIPLQQTCWFTDKGTKLVPL